MGVLILATAAAGGQVSASGAKGGGRGGLGGRGGGGVAQKHTPG